MKSLNFIRNMAAGENYSNKHVLVLDIVEKVARTGKPFVSLKLTDGDAVIQASRFDATKEDLQLLGITPGEVAEVSLCLKTPYYNLSDIALCDDPEIKADDFARTVPGDMEKMYSEICHSITNTIENAAFDSVGIITLELLKEYEPEYKRSSAAKCMHHNLVGGLLYHSYRMVKSAEYLCNVYPKLDKEILVCSAALHDIGKIRELTTDLTGETEYTVPGRLLGHALIGIQMVKEKAEELNYHSDRVSQLMHCIAAHHGKAEYGAITTPATAEAQALHLIDLLDAKMYQFEYAYNGIDEGMLSGKMFCLDGSTVYKPYGYDFDGTVAGEEE